MNTSVVRRFYRTVVRVVGVALVIAIGILAADEFWVNIPGLSGCETELCCETCENIPVDPDHASTARWSGSSGWRL